MEAIVLAGGLGTRLKSVVSELPKPMAPICDRPFLEYILNYLHKNGIKRVILSVGYKWETIKEYFGYSYENMELIYSIENEPLGTGGAIKKAMDKIKNKIFFIINGDTFFNIDLKNLTLKEDSKLMLSLKKMNNFDRYGCVEHKNGYITEFREKEYYERGDINCGIYLASTDIFDKYNIEYKFSFEEFIQNNFKELRTTSEVFDNYFIDIGIPEDYALAQKEIENYV
ncbi:nucleotidyltransferase family protein [Poseidonibacter lekithochrous]|uniref:D-glycero-D-manno-heptose 1-phosphate guanosyltransferase n=1 Tax=Poseidonibacter lekithochrous TaxID=1904463 RepID=UPI0008FCA345|nr:nucleotidyltransferase family protein [Poseidonibacter lekithochrous]QKJ22278.1 nucleotidyltransferase, WcbM_like subfamily [Poseidonibacter lekithochrous]